jgi:hypothetical protein
MSRRINSTAAKSASGVATSAKNDALVAMNIAKAETDLLEPENRDTAAADIWVSFVEADLR